MRPLRLTVGGLRSYTTEQHIDFTIAGLIAIIGDTGVGKSSLLEAIVFALYGGCTWDKRNATALIADGVNTMRVRLTFRCGNKTWEVFRAVSRSTSPPARHELLCLEDGTHYDTKQLVDSTIERLVGLNIKAFLKAVVLPQGKFQALLHTTSAERTAILKSVLGVDQLTAMQTAASAAHDRMRPVLEELARRRAGFMDNPQTEIAEAQQRLQRANERTSELSNARDTVTRSAAEQLELAQQAASIAELANELHRLHASSAGAELGALADLDQLLQAEKADLTTQTKALENVAEGLRDQLDTAARDGRDENTLRAAEAAINQALGQLPRIDTERRQAESDRAKLKADIAAAGNQRPLTKLMEEHAEKTEAEVEQARTTVTEATDALRACRDTVRTAREAAEAIQRASVDIERDRSHIGALEIKLETIAKELATAQARHNAAEGHLTEITRAQAAAHAAAACEPGDPCPVCTRDLPADFVAPIAGHEMDAVAERNTAAEHLAEKRQEHSGVTEEAKYRRERVTDAQDRLESSRDTLDALLEQLAPRLGAIDLAQNDAAIAAPLQSAVSRAEESVKDRLKVARRAREEATSAATTDQHTRAALQERGQALAATDADLARRTDTLAAQLAALPARHRVDVVTVDSLWRQLDHIRGWSAEVADTVRELHNVQAELTKVARDATALAARHLTEVERPAARLRRDVDNLYASAKRAAHLLKCSPPPPPPSEDLAEGADWATSLDQSVEDLLTAASTAKLEAEAKTRQLADEIASALNGVGVTDGDSLDQAHLDAAAQTQNAMEKLEEAEKQAPIVVDLANRLAVVTPLVDSLRELASLLADGQFPAVVVARRQRAFLALASQQLLAMTGSRFAFSDDFRVIDRYTSQPRDVRTLSGGETFLASLALALAVVDLASRTGGQVDAVFLDEGFGSLDANALTEALDALSRQTLGGRLVAVISHMRAVAESIDHVLHITKTPAGSQAAWLSPAERQQMVDTDVDGGLL